MTIQFACSGCRHKLKVSGEHAGKKVRCPKCHVLTVAPAARCDAGAAPQHKLVSKPVPEASGLLAAALDDEPAAGGDAAARHEEDPCPDASFELHSDRAQSSRPRGKRSRSRVSIDLSWVRTLAGWCSTAVFFCVVITATVSFFRTSARHAAVTNAMRVLNSRGSDAPNAHRKEQAIETLVTHASIAVPVLIRDLQGDADRQQVAYRALIAIGEPAVPALTAALSAGDASSRNTAIWTLLGLGAAAREATPTLCQLLASDDRTLCVSAAHAIGSIGGSASLAIPALVRGAKHSDPVVRSTCFASLRIYGSEAVTALPAVLAGFDDPDPIVRAEACRAAGGIGPKASTAVAALIEKYKTDKEPSVRGSAAEGLGGIGPAAKEAIPLLIAGLHDKSVLSASAVGLGGIGSAAHEAIPALIDALPVARSLAFGSQGHVVTTTHETLNSLGEVVDRRVFERREGMRGADDPDAPRKVYQALHQVRDGPAARVVDALSNSGSADTLVPLLGDANEFVATCAQKALKELGNVPVLTEALAHEDARVREAAARTLAEMRSPDAHRALSDMRSAASRDVRSAVASALRQPNAKNRPPSLRLVSADPDELLPDGSLVVALDADDPDGDPVSFQFRKAGDTDWQTVRDGRVALSDLEPGAIALEFRATDSAGASSESLTRSWISKLGELPAWQEDKVLRGHKQAVRGVAFNADASWLVSGGTDGSVRLWKLPTGRAEPVIWNHPDVSWGGRARLKQPPIPISSVHFDASVIVSIDGANRIRRWQADGDPQATFELGTAARSFMAVDPDGKLVVRAENFDSTTIQRVVPMHRIRSRTNTAPLWDSSPREQPGTITALVFSLDAEHVAVAHSATELGRWTVQPWKLGENRPLEAIQLQDDFPSPQPSQVRALQLQSPRTRCVIQTDDGLLRAWRLADGRLVAKLRVVPPREGSDVEQPLPLAMTRDGNLVAVGALDGSITLWRPVDGSTQRLQGHTATVLALSFDSSGQILSSGGADGSVRIWRPATAPAP